MSTLNKLEMAAVLARLNSQKVNLPIRISKIARDYFLESFKNEGFNGKKWEQVHRRIAGTAEYRYPKKKDLSRRTRGILLGKSRNLFKSIVNSQREASWRRIELGSDVPYAGYHNEGTDNLPKRQFMGHTPELDRRIKAEIKRQFDKVFKLT